MAAYPSAGLLLLLLLNICCGVAAALPFSYNFSVRGNGDIDSLNYTGDSSPSSDGVDLTTKGNHSSTGRVFYQQPVHLWDPRTNRTASFNTSFSFAISIGSGVSPNSTAQQDQGGGGMAFFIGPFPPNLGFFNGLPRDPNVVARSLSPPTVAVEFDTDHMGITINTWRYQNWNTTELVEGDSVSAGTMSANVVYDGGSKLMVVSLRVAIYRENIHHQQDSRLH
ncbi:hypothetical protein U9M48_001030 [Paspalum notatum var. saurae]|uniref:Legume lectin domain-containing protein n=1 Tax=Paspalum notatum var. saurae TaxID=547442 RepID=A0AAQ3SEX0_PASNO